MKTRRAISPIIATLLLILIAIAAGVVVYAYVIGFVGSSTSSNGSGAMQLTADQISIKASTGVTTLVLKNIGGGSAVLSNGFYISGSSLAATQLGFRVILTGTGTLSQLQDVQVLYVSSTQVKITVTQSGSGPDQFTASFLSTLVTSTCTISLSSTTGSCTIPQLPQSITPSSSFVADSGTISGFTPTASTTFSVGVITTSGTISVSSGGAFECDLFQQGVTALSLSAGTTYSLKVVANDGSTFNANVRAS